LTGWKWALNPMAYIVPSAYTLSGLVALTISANLATAASFLQGDELAGASRVRILASISWLSSIVGLLGGLTASFTGAFARPLAALAGAGIRYGAQVRALAGVYGNRLTTAVTSDDGASGTTQSRHEPPAAGPPPVK
jgi:hypothetical protein